MPNKFYEILKLMRLHAPAPYLMVFYPACYGLLLASTSIEDLMYLPIFFIGSITTRGAGCVINDMFDQDFDRLVERTKSRPLARGSLNITSAIILLFFLSIISCFILFSLTKTAIYCGFIACVMIVIYPLTKRFTFFPQVFLGFTFNIGALIGYSTIKDDISFSAIIMYLACCSWTIAYDTIYGFMDLKDDKKIGIKSMAIFLERRNYKVWLYFFYLTFIGLFLLASFNIQNKPFFSILSISLIIAIYMLIWQVRTLDINLPNNCLKRFKNNNYVGLILAFGLLAANYL